jgi:uncharacterized protein
MSTLKLENENPQGFHVIDALNHLRHYLPSQTPLKDFIHHNSLHAFQEKDFFSGIFQAASIFGFQVTLPLNDFRVLYSEGRIGKEVVKNVLQKSVPFGDISIWKERMLLKPYQTTRTSTIGKFRSEWKDRYRLDLDNLVQPKLFRVLCGYLDQGVAIWLFPEEENKGLLSAVRALESKSYTSLFKSARAKQLLHDQSVTTLDLLKIVVGNEAYFEQYLFDQQFSHPGWSGIVCAIEENPTSVLYKKSIQFQDAVHLELLLEIDALDTALGPQNWKPLSVGSEQKPLDLFTPYQITELDKVLQYWQLAFEWSYYDQVLRGVQALKQQATPPETIVQSKFAAIFCIDERECSLRRHLEQVEPASMTYGCPGFFGVEFYFQPENGKFYEKLCPAPVSPKYLIKESGSNHHRDSEWLYHKNTHGYLTGFVLNLGLGVVAAGKLALSLFKPAMSPAISDAFAHMDINGKLAIENKNLTHTENGLQLGFTIAEMVTRVEGLLRNIGFIQNYPDIIYVVGHGSSSANNPHHGAHDCGACSGRPGSVNARVLSFMANHPKVRAILKENGIDIPNKTQFVGALHDTAADQIAYYDIAELTTENTASHKLHAEKVEDALDLNAKERSRRFASIDTNQNIKQIREAIRQRSVSMFEPRPELGHGTNALCFVGNRALTKGLFLDRRAFMNSYDYRTDLDGKYLLNVMRPLPPVCGGINLEYYFSRVDNYRFGAGTKLPHNVMGLIGVANSSDGDLRTGLPLQMIEPHDPVRLLILVEHYPEVVLATIKSDIALYDWFLKEWVLLMAIHPDTSTFHFFKDGNFEQYAPAPGDVGEVSDINKWIEGTKEMQTNQINDATKEHLDVVIVKPKK